MMRFEESFLEEIRERLPMSDLAGTRVQLKKAGAEWRGKSPFNAEKTPSFYVNDRKRAWFDFSSGKNGNCFTFLMELDGLPFPEAVEECARMAGLPMPFGYRSDGAPASRDMLAKREAERAAAERKQAERRSKEERRQKTARELAYDIWKAAQPIDADTPAGRYLTLRGIEFAAAFASLRSARALEHRHPETGAVTRWPGLVAAVRAPDDGRFLAVWRIFLTPDGQKAPVSNAKLGLGSYTEAGGSVWLGKPGPAANVCEGIETGCGVFGLLGKREGVQAALSTSGMVNFVPPRGCERTLIWPDGDADRIKVDHRSGQERWNESPGHRAARTLNERLASERHPSSIQPQPKRGIDFLQSWQSAREFY